MGFTRGRYFKLFESASPPPTPTLGLYCLLCSSLLEEIKSLFTIRGQSSPICKSMRVFWCLFVCCCCFLLSKVFTVVYSMFKTKTLEMQFWWYPHTAIQIFHRLWWGHRPQSWGVPHAVVCRKEVWEWLAACPDFDFRLIAMLPVSLLFQFTDVGNACATVKPRFWNR